MLFKIKILASTGSVKCYVNIDLPDLSIIALTGSIKLPYSWNGPHLKINMGYID